MIVRRGRGVLDAPRMFHIDISWHRVRLPTASHRPFPRGCFGQRRYVRIGIMLHCQHFSRMSKSSITDESPQWKFCTQTSRRLGSVTGGNKGTTLFTLFGLVVWFALREDRSRLGWCSGASVTACACNFHGRALRRGRRRKEKIILKKKWKPNLISLRDLLGGYRSLQA